MLRFLFVTVVLFASLKGFTKTVLMPRDFLNPVVKARISADHEWKQMETFGNYYYGARTPERAISVKFDELVDIEGLEFEVLLSGTNRGPWMNFVNVAIYQDDKYIGFAPTSTSIIGTQSSGKSSLLKSIALAVIMAQSGLFVPAKEMNFSIYIYVNYQLISAFT